jgi:hypothetical protein
MSTASSGHAWAGNRPSRTATVRTGPSLGAFALSLTFVILLIVAPEQLDAAWQWIRDLPIVLEVLAWVVLLPWMLAYLAWNSSWDLWLRVVALAFLLGGIAMSFWRRNDS